MRTDHDHTGNRQAQRECLHAAAAAADRIGDEL